MFATNYHPPFLPTVHFWGSFILAPSFSQCLKTEKSLIFTQSYKYIGIIGLDMRLFSRFSYTVPPSSFSCILLIFPCFYFTRLWYTTNRVRTEIYREKYAKKQTKRFLRVLYFSPESLAKIFRCKQEKQKPKRDEKKKVEIFWSTNDGHLGHGFSLFYSNAAKLLENHNRS